MTSEEKRALIKRYIDAYNTFDIESLMELIHPQVSFSTIENGEANAKAEGLEEFRALAETSKTVFQSRQQSITGYLFNGENAVINIDSNGVLAQDLPGGPKAGEQLHLSGKTEFNFEGNKFKRIVNYS